MPHPCVVCGRSRMNPNNREEEYMFFGFPVNDEGRCQKWLEFCCREDLYKLTKKQLLQRMVCSKHFEQKDFLNEYLDRLNCTAVPSIYDPKQSLYNITCVLCGRSRRDPPDDDYDGATFHHFPGEEFRCLKWLDFVGVDSYYRLTRKEILFCYICSKHFDSSQFMEEYKSRLKDNAVPIIRYPDQLDSEDQYISNIESEVKYSIESEPQEKLDPLPRSVLESQECAACGRSRSDPRNKLDRYKFHPFPAYEIGRCLKWCQFLGREDILKMSPNQIRKLVLCSKHFQTGQSFHKVGPCDAVPTIRDISDTNEIIDNEQKFSSQTTDESSYIDTTKGMKNVFSRPLVSSKKPKVDNKPTPLAKKRGKSKRPTSINIPKPSDLNTFHCQGIKKLPLPPTNNWRLISNQYQPITLNSGMAAGSIAGEIKKVIFPFPSDISTLGTPIPVNSLSSIPPGFLIKINLPEQEQNFTQQTKIQNNCKIYNTDTNAAMQSRKLKNGKLTENIHIIKNAVQSPSENLSEFLSFSTAVMREDIDANEEMQEEYIEPSSVEYLKCEDNMSSQDEQYFEEYLETELEPVKQQKIKKRKRMSGTMRRTILPIRSELQYFLRKLAPQMHRLPRKARAQLKLSIVNMVIDHL